MESKTKGLHSGRRASQACDVGGGGQVCGDCDAGGGGFFCCGVGIGPVAGVGIGPAVEGLGSCCRGREEVLPLAAGSGLECLGMMLLER